MATKRVNKTKRVHLTNERIRKLTPPEGSQAVYIFDDAPKHLAVRVTPACVKSYVYAGKLNGSPLRITIGGVDTWLLEDARSEARRLQTLVDQGQDPRIEKQERLAETQAKQNAAKREEIRGLDSWVVYVEARRPKWGARSYSDHLAVIAEGGQLKTRGRKHGEGDKKQPGALRGLLDQPLRDVGPVQVQQWLSVEAAKRPTHAALCFRLLRAFVNWAVETPDYRDQIQANACAGRFVRDLLPRKQAKTDSLQREQLALWFQEVRKLPAIQACYLQTLLLSGARREEIAVMQWGDVDFRWGSLTIRDKVEGERTIPLTPYVAGLLQELKRAANTPPPEYRILNGKRIRNDLEHWKPSPWVFASRSAAGYIAEPRVAHNKALAAAGLPPLTIHGLRRSFGSLAEWVECPAGVVAQIMGHKPSAIAEKHYRVRPLDLLRMWHTKIEGWILDQAGIEQPKVVERRGVVKIATL